MVGQHGNPFKISVNSYGKNGYNVEKESKTAVKIIRILFLMKLLMTVSIFKFI